MTDFTAYFHDSYRDGSHSLKEQDGILVEVHQDATTYLYDLPSADMIEDFKFWCDGAFQDSDGEPNHDSIRVVE